MITLLIQHPDTGLYFKKPGEWVLHEEEARCFSNALSLYHYCHTHNLHHVDIVVKDKHQPQIPVLGKVPFQAVA